VIIIRVPKGGEGVALPASHYVKGRYSFSFRSFFRLVMVYIMHVSKIVFISSFHRWKKNLTSPYLNPSLRFMQNYRF